MSDTAIFKSLIEVFAKRANLKNGKFQMVCKIKISNNTTEILECYFKPIPEFFVPGFSEKK